MSSDFDYAHISEKEAVKILTTCWPLFFVLTTKGYKAELDTQNLLRLHNFKRLRLAGGFENSLIQKTAKMNQQGIALLKAALEYQQTKRKAGSI